MTVPLAAMLLAGASIGAATAGATTSSTSLSSASSASSGTTHGEGTYEVTGATVHRVRQVASMTVIDQTLFITNAGVLDGPSTAEVTCVFNTTGTGGCAGVEHFTGTIGGRTGTASFGVALRVDATGFHGEFLTLDGDGGLEGLRGSGSFEGGSSGTNSFDYAFRA